ncbi:MAG: alpha/beta fold hydrolase [Vicinamibacterales bacterium]
MRNIALALMFTSAVSPAAAQTPVTLKAADGLTLKATYYSPGTPGPALMLLHQCNRDRSAWAAFAAKAVARGYHVMAMDYRGFGESEGARFSTLLEQQPIINEKWPGDVDAAFAWLAGQAGVDKNRVGAAGASCGVNQAVLLSARHPEVRSLVLLSGGTTPEARTHLQRSASPPILAAASDDDGDAVNTMRWILGWSHDPRNKFLGFKAAGHGTDMFPVEKGLEPQLLDWLDATLVATPARAETTTGLPTKPSPVEEFWSALAQPGGGGQGACPV